MKKNATKSIIREACELRLHDMNRILVITNSLTSRENSAKEILMEALYRNRGYSDFGRFIDGLGLLANLLFLGHCTYVFPLAANSGVRNLSEARMRFSKLKELWGVTWKIKDRNKTAITVEFKTN